MVLSRFQNLGVFFSVFCAFGWWQRTRQRQGVCDLGEVWFFSKKPGGAKYFKVFAQIVLTEKLFS